MAGRRNYLWGILCGGIVSLSSTLFALALLAAEVPAWLAMVVLAAHIPWNLVLLIGVWRSTERGGVSRETAWCPSAHPGLGDLAVSGLARRAPARRQQVARPRHQRRAIGSRNVAAFASGPQTAEACVAASTPFARATGNASWPRERARRRWSRSHGADALPAGFWAQRHAAVIRPTTAEGLICSGLTPSAQDNNPGRAFAPNRATFLPVSWKCTVRSVRRSAACTRPSAFSRCALLPDFRQFANPTGHLGRSTRMVSCAAVIRTVSSRRTALSSPATSKAIGCGLTLASLHARGLSARR